MPNFFNGWIGYGSSVQNFALREPNDSAYVRRPIVFGAMENGRTFDTTGGTVGPAGVGWGTLTIAGLFDAPVAGNLLVTFPLARPVIVAAGATYTTGPAGNIFEGLDRSRASITAILSPGTVLCLTPDGRSVVANILIQISGGVLSAQNLSFGSTVSMPMLPSQPPAAGSGQIWNNGGILGVA